MSFNMCPAEMLAAKFGGAPEEGEFGKQIMAADSSLGALVYELLHTDTIPPKFEPNEVIAIALLTVPAREATELEILDVFRSLPSCRRIQGNGTAKERAAVEQVVAGLKSCLAENKYNFDVDFPPDGYRELRRKPGDSDKRAQDRWHAKVGLEMAEEEDSSSPRYQCDYGNLDADYYQDFVHEYYMHRLEEGSLTSYVYVLPPGQENIIFASRYRDLSEADCPALPRCAVSPATFGDLPMELKQRILRYVLVLPGKVRVTASADDDGTMPEDPLSQLDAATYKFSMSVKIPQYLVLRDGEFGWERPYYWFLEQPSTLLSVCTVNKELHQLGRSIFYGENYFEVLDDSRDHRIRDWLEDDSCAGPQLTHRWLELMGAASSRDKCPRYGETPLTLLRTLNIDLWPYKGEYFAQTDWHFELIVNALLPVPGLRKLVINVRVTALEMLGTGDSLVDGRPSSDLAWIL
jgi:hypothetical protein